MNSSELLHVRVRGGGEEGVRGQILKNREVVQHEATTHEVVHVQS